MALASVSDLEARLGETPGTLAGTDLTRATNALEDVSTLALAEAGNGVTWTDLTVPAAVKVVVIQAALRAYQNPSGYTGESVGDYSYQYGQAQGSVSLYLSETERAIVQNAAKGTGVSRTFVGTVRTPSAYTYGAYETPVETFWGL